MKVLVLGYSVTAETPGFVEIADAMPETASYTLHKVGLGGFQPSSAIHVFNTEIQRWHPDIVILEQSTPAFRLYSPNRSDYSLWLMSLLRSCAEINAKFGFLELPRRDLDFQNDWVIDLHKDYCERYGLGQIIGPKDRGLLRDEVHPNENGRQYFAESLIAAIKGSGAIRIDNSEFIGVPEYMALQINKMIGSEKFSVETYNRSGFDSDMIFLKPKETLSISFDQPICINGYIGMSGPKSGNMWVTLNDECKKIAMHDKYSYYNRPSAHILYSHSNVNKYQCMKIDFEQSPELPDVELLKGEKDTSIRSGAVSHLLVTKVPMSNSKIIKSRTSHREPHEDKIFARGFILFKKSDVLADLFFSSTVGAYLKSWEKTFFGPCQLWHHPKLNYATCRDAKVGVGILGLCINPFDGSATNQAIAENLYRALLVSKSNFLDYVDQLSGSFTIVYRLNASVHILQDCAATKPVYFFNSSEFGMVVASHANLLALPLGLKRDPRSTYVFSNEVYKSDPSRYLPGDITPYTGLKLLTANTSLDFTTGEPNRFFPREALPERELNKLLILEISDIFLKQAQMLAATGRPIRVAATAGRDSRVSVAAFSQYKNAELFSFHFPNTGHLTDDVEIARKLADLVGQKLSVYNLPEYGVANFLQSWNLNTANGVWPAAALCYLTEFSDDAIHVRSTVSEIGRVFYGRRPAASVTAAGLSSSYTVTDFGKDPIVIDAMDKFISQTDFNEDKFFNYSIYDMFYWEHRNSKWQNILCQEAEMATDVFIPFNNRNLIKLFLSIPAEQRKAAILHVEIAKKMCPQIADVPYIS